MSPRAGCTRSSVCLLRTGPAPGPCGRRPPGCPGAFGSTSYRRPLLLLLLLLRCPRCRRAAVPADPSRAPRRYMEHLTPRIMQSVSVRVFAVCQKQRRRRGVKLAGGGRRRKLARLPFTVRAECGRCLWSAGLKSRWPVSLKIRSEIISCYLIKVSAGHWIR